jgi:hypothetical protein
MTDCYVMFNTSHTDLYPQFICKLSALVTWNTAHVHQKDEMINAVYGEDPNVL